jgi:hypothetical protein
MRKNLATVIFYFETIEEATQSKSFAESQGNFAAIGHHAGMFEVHVHRRASHKEECRAQQAFEAIKEPSCRS